MGIAAKFKPAKSTTALVLATAAIGTALGAAVLHNRMSRRVDELEEITKLNTKVTLGLVNALGTSTVRQTFD